MQEVFCGYFEAEHRDGKRVGPTRTLVQTLRAQFLRYDTVQ
jgi:hypothetical protein